jgi:hypothetical protein
MKIIVMEFSPFTCYFLLLVPNIFLQSAILKHVLHVLLP